VLQELQEQLGLRVLQEQQELKELQEHKEHRDHKEIQEHRELQDHKVQKDRKVKYLYQRPLSLCMLTLLILLLHLQLMVN
jgi:hypothetical protein